MRGPKSNESLSTACPRTLRRSVMAARATALPRLAVGALVMGAATLAVPAVAEGYVFLTTADGVPSAGLSLLSPSTSTRP